MSKSPTKKKQRPVENNAKAASDHVTHVMRIQPTRETVESVAVAVVLAFLFRSFVAEAFVIPTGSMAPTLQGQHVDVECPECSIQYRANASGEARDGSYVVRSVCPNCRFHLKLDRDKKRNQRSFTGDRILVSKFAYELGDPERWDVIVFKFPGNAKQNYIKRLIGLPNELIRIRHGDIHVAKRLFTMNGMEHEALAEGRVSAAAREEFAAAGRELPDDIEVVPYLNTLESHDSQHISMGWQIRDISNGTAYEVRYRHAADQNLVTEFFDPFQIARKPADKATLLLQLVYDTAHQSETLKDIGWPARWQSADGSDSWKQLKENGGYQVDPEVGDREDGETMIRYRHYFPTQDQWLEIEQTADLPEGSHEGQLITDHYAYNDFADKAPYSSGDGVYDESKKQGMNWVGDLALEVDVEVGGDKGLLIFDLVEGGVHFRCQINVATGEAKLSRSDGGVFGIGEKIAATPTGQTRVTKQREYNIRLENVDDELRLWVDGDLIEFDVPATYVRLTDPRPRWSEQDASDFEPAGVGTQGLVATFRRLQLFRDIYYIALNGESDYETASGWSDTKRIDFYRSPEEWGLPQKREFFANRSLVEFFVEDDCFMPLGDNSPSSSDARYWHDNGGGFRLDDDLGYHAYPYFHRDYLIGKAILIYWPHGWRTGIKFLQIPNVKRMGLIR